MDQTATLQGKRATNWSSEEASLLVELVESNYAKLFGRHSLSTTQTGKARIWAGISGRVCALGCKRISKDCIKKIQYLKSEAKKHRAHRSGTGGGPALPDTPPKYRKILNMILKDAVDGIRGIQR